MGTFKSRRKWSIYEINVHGCYAPELQEKEGPFAGAAQDFAVDSSNKLRTKTW